jgi:hypothetical protein
MKLTVQPNDRGLDGYSATVEIELHTAEGVFYRTHTAHDRIIFAKPQTIPLGVARLILIIDGQRQESTVEVLPHESPSEWIPLRILHS